MNKIIVPKTTYIDPNVILEKLAELLPSLTPQLRRAASYILENQNDVGVSSIRELAAKADVKPNTLVRLSSELGFKSYDDFREPFRELIRQGTPKFEDRARWLQAISKGGQLGTIYADMVAAALDNIEQTFANIDASQLEEAAKTIWNSRRTYIAGVGVNSANAQNFTYLASTGMVDFHAIPKLGNNAADDLAWANETDVLIAMTCKPYRNEILETLQVAKEQGLTIIGISDSPASPIITGSDFGFIVSVETPQFFPSSVATIALLETLLSFVIASASPDIVDRVDQFHKRRHALGRYFED